VSISINLKMFLEIVDRMGGKNYIFYDYRI